MHHVRELWNSLKTMRRYEEAIRNLEHAIELAKKCSILAHVIYTVELATVYSLKGDHAIAMDLIADVEYERISGYKDSFAELLYLYSDIYIRNGNTKGALEWFSRAENYVNNVPRRNRHLYMTNVNKVALIQKLMYSHLHEKVSLTSGVIYPLAAPSDECTNKWIASKFSL